MFTKRINNDFYIMASVYENNVWKDMSQVEITNARIVCGSKTYPLVLNDDYVIENGILKVHVTNVIATTIGIYSLIVTYRTQDYSSDGYFDCEFDSKIFKIVGLTEQEDADDFTTDVHIVAAINGKSAYDIWLSNGNVGTEEDYLAWVQQPSLQAAQTANDATALANSATQSANEATQKALQAAQIANQAMINWDKNW